jgi:hypothetical protein
MKKEPRINTGPSATDATQSRNTTVAQSRPRDSGGSPPVYRELRGYALDPSLGQRLQTAKISEMTFRLPWEKLAPGPVDEYIEVVDYDPAAKCFYKPVDLDNPYLLAQDGLTPSEGTPQFHQQMAYAVARLTIHNFELALGRRALWAPGPPPKGKSEKNDSHYVQRLRIYPHALRDANAYYSPAKKALLLGYFGAPEGDADPDMPGAMVFTALSHDIVAHETAHALLDGMHRRFGIPTNPDMLAFHEAFADIVALFQHFTFPDLMRHEMAHTRGDIQSQETQLGQLASEFGRAIGVRGALRDYIGAVDKETGVWKRNEPNPRDYQTTTEPHARGAILVSAVFQAFTAIYRSRVEDLMRLSTSGTGVLPAGAVHPDLVNRLGDEASKAAAHVLKMCVRGLDYCPPVDLTFGEYLRAVITADYDAYPDDGRNYRVAFVEAFRRRGLYPRDVRALSADNLVWRTAENEERSPSTELRRLLGRLRPHASRHFFARTRQNLFEMERETREILHVWLVEHFASAKTGADDAVFLGLDSNASFQVHSAHFATREGRYGRSHVQLVAQFVQDKKVLIDEKDPAKGSMTFAGGSTLIVDLQRPLRIAFCIRKPTSSPTRQRRQLEFRASAATASVRSTYFAEPEDSVPREPFALLHRGELGGSQ